MYPMLHYNNPFLFLLVVPWSFGSLFSLRVTAWQVWQVGTALPRHFATLTILHTCTATTHQRAHGHTCPLEGGKKLDETVWPTYPSSPRTLQCPREIRYQRSIERTDAVEPNPSKVLLNKPSHSWFTGKSTSVTALVQWEGQILILNRDTRFTHPCSYFK